MFQAYVAFRFNCFVDASTRKFGKSHTAKRSKAVLTDIA